MKEATDDADITCIYGIRALATIVLYVAHQLITISRIPFSNRTFLTEVRTLETSSPLVTERHDISLHRLNVAQIDRQQPDQQCSSSIISLHGRVSAAERCPHRLQHGEGTENSR